MDGELEVMELEVVVFKVVADACPEESAASVEDPDAGPALLVVDPLSDGKVVDIDVNREEVILDVVDGSVDCVVDPSEDPEVTPCEVKPAESQTEKPQGDDHREKSTELT